MMLFYNAEGVLTLLGGDGDLLWLVRALIVGGTLALVAGTWRRRRITDAPVTADGAIPDNVAAA